MAEGLWACGTLGRAHGLTGELYLDLVPGGIERLSGGERFLLARVGVDEPAPVGLRRTGGTDRHPLVCLDGIDTREAAIAVQGSLVLASGPALDDGDSYRVSELVGMRVMAGERELGVVDDVLMSPAHDILQIALPDGKHELVPFVAELVDVEAGERTIRVRDGLL